MQEIRSKARQLMKGFCSVCPECNGKVCAGQVPGMGGLNTASSFKNNVQALAELRLNMRLLHGVSEANLTCETLGLKLSLPIIAAPIGGISFNTGVQEYEPTYTAAIVHGCKEAGTIGCVGDGVPEWILGASLDALKAENGYGIPFIKPWDSDELFTKLETCLAAGAKVVGMDIDAAGLITLRKMGRPVSPKTPENVKKIIDLVHGKGAKFILKGIMTPVDACIAAEIGVDGIVVSNHGGRVLDHTPGTAEVLPSIRESVKTDMAIWVDGGVRSGTDVFKMLALGADAVLIGRPYSIAAIGGGVEGVKTFTELVRSQLMASMVLTGCATVKDISSAALFK